MIFLINSRFIVVCSTLVDVDLRVNNVADGAFANLSRLMVLTVNLNPSLITVHNSWFPLACQLSFLSLDSNGLQELPVPFLPMCGRTLSNLRVSHNALSSLPAGLFGVPYPALRTL